MQWDLCLRSCSGVWTHTSLGTRSPKLYSFVKNDFHCAFLPCFKLVCPLRDIQIVSISWLLSMMLQWILECRCLFDIVILFPLAGQTVVGSAGSYDGSIFSFFWGASLLLCAMAVTTCILANSIRAFLCLPTLSSLLYIFDDSHSKWDKWYLVLVLIFISVTMDPPSFTYRSLTYLLLRNVCLLLLIFF